MLGNYRNKTKNKNKIHDKQTFDEKGFSSTIYANIHQQWSMNNVNNEMTLTLIQSLRYNKLRTLPSIG